MEMVNALGRRKSAVARIFVTEGTGKITINNKDLQDYFPSSILQYVVKQPLAKLDVVEKYDIKVNLDGGGFTGQSQALRLAIARATLCPMGWWLTRKRRHCAASMHVWRWICRGIYTMIT